MASPLVWGAMRYQYTITFVVFLAVCAPASGRQVGSWENAKDLDPGTRISVKDFKLLPAIRCDFEWANERELACTLASRVPFGRTPQRFERRHIRRVRLEHSDIFNSKVGAAVGAGIGAAMGASSREGRRSGAWLEGAGLFGFFGAHWGTVIPLLHGKVVYSR